MNHEEQKPQIDPQAHMLDNLAREILGESYLSLSTESLKLDEDFLKGKAKVTASLRETMGTQSRLIDIEGEGVGLVDAFFDGMLAAFAPENKSLNGVALVDFNINTKLEGAKGRKTDAAATAALRVRNSDKYEFTFIHKTPSISQSSVAAVQYSIGFFVNSERAYIKLHVALEDAKSRSRPDLVEKYQRQMSVLVHATSYQDVVKNLSIR